MAFLFPSSSSAQKMKFFMKDFFSVFCKKLRIRSYFTKGVPKIIFYFFYAAIVLMSNILPLRCKDHCIKSVCIRSFSGVYFPAFGLNSVTYSVTYSVQMWENMDLKSLGGDIWYLIKTKRVRY